MALAQAFRLMAGNWQGRTMYIPANGGPLVRKRLTVVCGIRDSAMFITNTYVDETGEALVAEVHGDFDDAGRLHISSERTEGIAWESCGNILAEWHSKADPRLRFWELAVITEGSYRTRTWHHYCEDQLEGVTIFEEHKHD